MNDPEVIMHKALPSNNLIAQQKALEAAGIAQAGAVDGPRTDVAIRIFDEVRAMTWRLLHPSPNLR